MESVVLVVTREHEAALRGRLNSNKLFASVAAGRWVSEGATGRVYVSLGEYVTSEMEPEDLSRIESAVSDPVFFVVDFSDIGACRVVLGSIADDPMILVDNDHGLTMRGSEFVERLRMHPNWDWRSE